MATYKVLNKQVFSSGDFSLVPIRIDDRYAIMRWRNEQIYHLRQNKALTETDQDSYFVNIISKLFDEENPSQILFSYLEGEKCIGYGGLVHINWLDKNAEISFVMDTVMEEDFFTFHWNTYLGLIEEIAFKEINLHKIFTYAFDLRSKLYDALEGRGYVREARLKEHCFFEGRLIDVLIHSKNINNLYLRDAVMGDMDVTYFWANNPDTRKYAFNQGFIPVEDHQNWFIAKLNDTNCIYQLCEKGGESVGSVRFDINEQEGLISYLIAPNHTGKGFGTKMLELALQHIENKRPDIKIVKGLVKKENAASLKIFEKLGFERKNLIDDIIEYTLKIYHADTKL